MAIISRFTFPCAMLLVLVVACGKDSNPVDGGTPPDTTPPGITAINPLDANHVDVVFNEALTRATAQDLDHYFLAETGTPVSGNLAWSTPGDTIAIRAAVLRPDQKTVTLTTLDSMAGRNGALKVQGVADTDGNAITTLVERLFAGSDDADVTAPEIVRRFPAPGATGVAVGFPVRIQFSEPLNSYTFALKQGGSPVAFVLDAHDATTWELNPVDLLEYDTEYTVDASASDGANPMAPAQWTFRTTASIDVTPPTLVATAPANLSVGVGVNANLSATFSEPIDQEYSHVVLTPDPGAGEATWSEDGRTVVFNPDAALLADQQYTFAIYPGDLRDLAGNEITRLYTVVFTTADALEKGAIAGLLTGDAGTAAADPTNAVVIACNAPFDPGPFLTLASTVVAPNNTYNVLRLPDGVYYLVAILDTNHDGRLEPDAGDAVGAYGIDAWPATVGQASVEIANGARETDRGFPLVDPSSVRGALTYSGAYAAGPWTAHVALFDTTAFDTLNTPAAATLTLWPETPGWDMLSIDEGFPDGVYYALAYLDVNTNGTFEPAIDPWGMYGGASEPTPLDVKNGADFKDIVIAMADPVAASAARVSVTWPAPGRSPAFQLIQEIARRGLTAN